MIKNALLSLKKNIGRTILLFFIIVLITNLVIAGLSIQSASNKEMQQLQSQLGNDVTLTVNFKNMMQDRQPGEAVNEQSNQITLEMADSVKNLKYVKNYNYTISTSANSDSVSAIKSESSNNMPGRKEDEGDLTISANTTMKYLDSFTNERYKLTSGRLLTAKDSSSQNCVIEKNLASDNNLSVGDTFTVYTTVNDQKISQELTVVGIYEIQSSDNMQIGDAHFNNPVNTIYTGLSVGQTLSNSSENLTSATYYLDDPKNADSFVKLAKKKTSIDFNTYSLETNEQMYKQNASSLENMKSYAQLFVWIIVIGGSAILCLILALTIRNRYYEFGVLLSLGQTKVKIILQQLLEILVIAVIAIVISLGTGKVAANSIYQVMESSQTVQQNDGPQHMDNNKQDQQKELDVSITSDNVIELFAITGAVCVVSIIVPATYILRLSPREILTRKEG